MEVCISPSMALSEGSISFRGFEVTFSSTLLISSFIWLNFSVVVSSVSLLFASRYPTFQVSSSILLLFPLTSFFISLISAIMSFNIFAIGSSTVSTGSFFAFLLNFDFSLLVSFKFLWFLYLLASWSLLEMGGFFLFFGLDSSLDGS